MATTVISLGLSALLPVYYRWPTYYSSSAEVAYCIQITELVMTLSLISNGG